MRIHIPVSLEDCYNGKTIKAAYKKQSLCPKVKYLHFIRVTTCLYLTTISNIFCSVEVVEPVVLRIYNSALSAMVKG